MDITKNVLRKLGKENIPTVLVPSVYPGKINLMNLFSIINISNISEEKSTNEPTIPINSVSGCLQALTQCHSTISEQDVSRLIILF